MSYPCLIYNSRGHQKYVTKPSDLVGLDPDWKISHLLPKKADTIMATLAEQAPKSPDIPPQMVPEKRKPGRPPKAR